MDALDFIIGVEQGEITDPQEIRAGLIAHKNVVLRLQGFWGRLYRDLVINWDGE